MGATSASRSRWQRSGRRGPVGIWIALAGLAVALSAAGAVEPTAPPEAPVKAPVEAPVEAPRIPPSTILPEPRAPSIDETTYVLGPGDVLSVYVQVPAPIAVEDATVSLQGRLYLGDPLGSMDVQGKTIAEFRSLLLERAQRYYTAPEVEAHLRRVRTFAVPVTGRIAYPNEYIVPQTTRMLQLISHAGDVLPTGSSRHVLLTRADGTRLDLDYRKIAVEGDMEQNVELQAGDQVFVPARGPTFTITGAVNEPRAGQMPEKRPSRAAEEPTEPTLEALDYEFRQGETIIDAIRLAGGFTSAAVPSAMSLTRQRGESYERVSAAFTAMLAPEPKVPPLPLEPGDRIYVPSVTDVQVPVAISGQVKQPGSYFVGAGTRLSELLIRAGGANPGSALQRVQLTHTGPDGQPRMSIVDLLKASSDPSLDPVLDAGTIVYVPSLAEVSARILVSGGFVARGVSDGQYLLHEGETLHMFLQATGGLLPSADPTRVVVERSRPDGQIDKLEFNVLRIEEGHQEDPVLYGGDRLVAADRYAYQPRILVRGFFQAPPPTVPVGEGGADAAMEKTQPAEATGMPEHDYFISPGETLTQVVRRMGGVRPEGDPRHLRIERLIGGVYTLIPVDYIAILAAEAPDIVMQAGDVLEAPSRELYKDQVTLAGEFVGAGVFVPAPALAREGAAATPAAAPGGISGEMPRGKYRIRQGERVLDVITETGGLTAKAAAHMAFIRRPEPDGTIEKIPVDLVKLVVFGDDTQNIELRNGDEFVVPRITDQVYVVGEVRAPGAFPFQEDRYVRDYIALAGGPTDRTLTREGWVVRDLAEGQPQVIPINVGAAIQAADPKSNLGMEPGDMIVVPRENFVMKRDFPSILPSLAVLITSLGIIPGF